jgi:hypothetical protein
MSLTWNAIHPMDSRNMPEGNRITNADIAAFVEGIADNATQRRVLAASLVDARIRQRIALLRTVDTATDLYILPTEVTPGVERLTAFVQNSIRALHEAQMQLRQALTKRHKGGGLWSVSENVRAVVQETLKTVADKTLALGPRVSLGLPCFAPASASSVQNSLDVMKQVVPTQDGVRIEFHQLPGMPQRFRVLVDASEHRSESGENPSLIRTTEGDDFGYNVAYLTLEDSEGEAIDRHLLVVALNSEGRGFTEFSLGGEGIYAMPFPKGLCRLTEVALSQVWGDPVGEGGGGNP